MTGVATNDPVGKSGIGEFFEVHTGAIGLKWQMGVAVNLLNRKFDFGTSIKYTLAADSFGSGSLAVNAREMGITAINLDINSLPSNYLQHGDRARIGPSTFIGDEGRAESVRVAAAAQNTATSIIWGAGMLYSIDRLNKYRYSLSDPVTVYGTGVGFGWEVLNAHMATLGIFKGYSSLGQMGRYSPNKSEFEEAHVTQWENTLGTDFIGLKIMLPSHASYVVTNAAGPDISPAVFNSKIGLAPWRDVTSPPSEINDNTWDFAGKSGIVKTDLTFATSTDTITSVGGGFNALGLVDGDLFIVQGSASNDGTKTVATITNNVIDTVENLVDESAGASVTISSSALKFKGVFRYMREHADAASDPFARLAYDTNTTNGFPQGLDMNVSNTYAPLLTGFVHTGGEFKDTAQCLMTMVNSIADTNGSDKRSIGMFSQRLYRGTGDTRDVSFAKLVPGTYYRLGITWRGTVRPDNAADTIESEVFAKFQFGPVTDLTEAAAEIAKTFISTNPLLSNTIRSITKYRSDMVTGFVQTIDTDDLDTFDNLRIDLVMKAESPTTYYNGRDSRGTEIQLFIDNIWLEHEGDIPNATGKGYVEIDHLPESGTLLVNRFRLNKPVTISTFTSQQTVDPSGGGQRYLHQIDGAFERVTQEVWQQFKALLRWQDFGYLLTLHPFLPEVPHCLVGRLEISGVSKSFWDLTRHSFKFKFTEVE